jgi:hypothetical protein
MVRLDEYLTPVEFSYLEQIRDGARLRDAVPNPNRERLIELGYAQEVLGSLTLTDAGRMRISTWHDADRRLIGPLAAWCRCRLRPVGIQGPTIAMRSIIASAPGSPCSASSFDR